MSVAREYNKLPESGVLCDNITEFGVGRFTWARRVKVIFRHPKQSNIATQHTRRQFCVYAMLFI